MPLTKPSAKQLTTTTLNIDDPIIEINKALTGANTDDIGFILNRGTSGNNVAILWDRSAGQFALVETTADGSSSGDLAITGYADLRVGTITADSGVPTGPAGVFSDAYTSTEQTITSAGLLQLAHGLGSKPELVQFYLKCQTAELGYSIGDEVLIDNPSGDKGISCVMDATNINIRFSSTLSAFTLLNKSTGATDEITNTYWKLIAKAWV